MNRTFAVLDLRCEDISATAAHWKKNGDYGLEEFFIHPSRGIHKGVITNIAHAADSISNILDKLKKKTKKRIQDVYASISPLSVKIIPSRGTLLLSRYGREISPQDMEKCIRMGSIIKLPPGREPLHKIVKWFFIDGESRIENPVGLEGVKLGVEMNIVTADSSAISNLAKSIALAGFSTAGVILSGIAYANRVLTEKDTEKGTASVNMCKDLTEAMVFHKRILKGCKIFRMGTDNIFSQDDDIDQDGVNHLTSALRSLAGWENVREIVLTGEATMKEGILEPLENLSHHPVRFGFCIARPFEDLPAERRGYIGSLGMLDYLHREKKMQRIQGNLFQQTFHKTLSFINKYF